MYLNEDLYISIPTKLNRCYPDYLLSIVARLRCAKRMILHLKILNTERFAMAYFFSEI